MTYAPIADYARHPILVCETCGAAIADTDAHDRFHGAAEEPTP